MRFGIWRAIGMQDLAWLGARRGGRWLSGDPADVVAAAGGRPCAEWALYRNSARRVRLLSALWVVGLLSCLLALGWAWHTRAPEPSSAQLALALTAAVAAWSLAGVRRHAGDRDHIFMTTGAVHVLRVRGSQHHTTEFKSRWVRIEPMTHDRSPIRLSGQGQAVVVGEFVPADSRRALADELRAALRHVDA